MARFTDLANELILEILKHVSPSDVDTFCQLSKSIRVLSASFLRDHRELQREYWTWSDLMIGDGLNRRRGPAQLLKAILHDPRVAPYVRRLHYIGSHLHTGRKEFKGLRNRAIKETKMLSKAEKRVWLEERPRNSAWERQCFALLIPLLPNLEKLRLWCCGEWPIIEMLAKIAATEPTGLKKLKAVDVGGAGEWEEAVGYEDLLKAIIKLPALEQLAISNLAFSVDVSDFDEVPSILPRSQKSYIARIHLIECSSACPLLLTGSISLECLTSFTCYWGCESPHDPTPKWVCKALVKQAGSTLKYLKLTCPFAPKNLVGSLQGFVVLEQVVINRELLVDEKCPSWAQKLPTNILSLDLYDDGYPPNKLGSLDPLKLTNDTVRLMEELLSHQLSEVPKLVKVQYMPDEDMVARMSDGIVKLMKYYLEREYRSAGIQFTMLEGQPGYTAEDAESEEASGWDTKFD